MPSSSVVPGKLWGALVDLSVTVVSHDTKMSHFSTVYMTWLSWKAPQAQQLLDEEAEELVKLRELDETIQGGRARVQGLLSQQQHLSQQLSASLITVS